MNTPTPRLQAPTTCGAFTYLKPLPIDGLKIDIEFVRDATTNPASRHLIARW